MNKIDLKSLEIKKLIESSIVCKDYTEIDLIGVFFSSDYDLWNKLLYN